MTKYPVNDFLGKLASEAPTPGGGSVAALMGSMGAALVSMVANLTVGKKKYESVEQEVKKLLVDSEALRLLLEEAIEKDVEAFGQVMAAYGLPKDSTDERAVRTEKIQEALKDAINAPMECAMLTAKVIPLCKEIAKVGNVNIISDAGVAVLAARAAFKSAELNVYVNVSSLKDREFASKKIDQIKELGAVVEKGEQETFDYVKQVILKI